MSRDCKDRNRRNIKALKTGFSIVITVSGLPADYPSAAILPTLLNILSNAGINPKGIQFTLTPDGFLFGFLIFPDKLACFQQIIGTSPINGVPLSSIPGFAPLVNLFPPGTVDATVTNISIQDALIVVFRHRPDAFIQQTIIAYIEGSGFLINRYFLLDKIAVITSLPTDISPTFDAKLMIGALLPLLGEKYCDKRKKHHRGERERGCDKGRWPNYGQGDCPNFGRGGDCYPGVGGGIPPRFF